MTPSKNCIDIIKMFEGCELKAYICPAGKPTIGYGHTKNVKLTDVISKECANKLLEDDIKEFSISLERELQRHNIDVNQNQFDALVSFAFNLGLGNLLNSSIWAKMKYKDFQGAADSFLRWNKAKVKGVLTELKGLTKRRQAERELFLS